MIVSALIARRYTADNQFTLLSAFRVEYAGAVAGYVAGTLESERYAHGARSAAFFGDHLGRARGVVEVRGIGG